ncbi:Imm51 family immunity protein [Gemella sanguinis]|jgi:hypothetical protein|uniref:Imm51 family immunity protein n=1 Tax=Gemella sanguinis TaxID=84135 RepID=UPI00352CF1FF
MDYVKILKYGKIINLTFYIEHDKPFEIGEKINGIYEKAYMNGYNWEAFLNYYLEKKSPEVLEGIEMDPEAGILTAYYDNTLGNEEKAEKLKNIIIDLIENEEKLYKVLKDEGSKINWD